MFELQTWDSMEKGTGPQIDEDSWAKERKMPKEWQAPNQECDSVQQDLFQERSVPWQIPPQSKLPVSANSRIHKKKGSHAQSIFLRGHFASRCV